MWKSITLNIILVSYLYSILSFYKALIYKNPGWSSEQNDMLFWSCVCHCVTFLQLVLHVTVYSVIVCFFHNFHVFYKLIFFYFYTISSFSLYSLSYYLFTVSCFATMQNYTKRYRNKIEFTLFFWLTSAVSLIFHPFPSNLLASFW